MQLSVPEALRLFSADYFSCGAREDRSESFAKWLIRPTAGSWCAWRRHSITAARPPKYFDLCNMESVKGWDPHLSGELQHIEVASQADKAIVL
jgi:hypothetical protein